ncbi:putative DCC family thiol-disulfide oxidoreductase YuxK [Winogradskyella wandonensis]|uniref:Putative DCC family thiol-disulfide oxidoreductase YuxK n=2 Tax=Winogradskyella wandonensis TaxID=1442586 RepID=A0A4R1KIM5_9FLAO|nr:putative DCC family thiol-disulfide oxidoreductase YuxK [Winogradskyella wandonensis]
MKVTQHSYVYINQNQIVMTNQTQKDLIIFDGECNLCNGVVGWLLKFAPEDLFQFVAFQSAYGQQLLHQHGFPTKRLDTVILIDASGVKTHSDGFLKIISKIPKWKRVAALLGFIPRLIRDYIYKTASKNRVKWFGNSKSCTIDFR